MNGPPGARKSAPPWQGPAAADEQARPAAAARCTTGLGVGPTATTAPAAAATISVPTATGEMFYITYSYIIQVHMVPRAVLSLEVVTMKTEGCVLTFKPL